MTGQRRPAPLQRQPPRSGGVVTWTQGHQCRTDVGSQRGRDAAITEWMTTDDGRRAVVEAVTSSATCWGLIAEAAMLARETSPPSSRRWRLLSRLVLVAEQIARGDA